MEKIDARVMKSSRSILNLEKLLTQIIDDPNNFVKDELLLASLHSQGRLASYASSEKSIFPTSLNTLKRIANKVVVGGFKKLDRLRVSAKDALLVLKRKSESSHKENTKQHLYKKIKDLEIQLQISLQDTWHITMALEKSISQGRYYAEQTHDFALLELCIKEQRELLQSLSLLSHRPDLSKER